MDKERLEYIRRNLTIPEPGKRYTGKWLATMAIELLGRVDELTTERDALIASVREDCAKVCEDMYDTCVMAATAEKKSEYQVMAGACAECAEAIRNLKGGS